MVWPSCLRQPLILGYVLGGFLIGPFTPGPTLSEVHQFEVLAEIGVILLMYSIGLEFSFSELLQVKWVAIFGGAAGDTALDWHGRGCGTVDGLEPTTRELQWALLFPSPAPWCSPACWRTAANCARPMAT